MIKIALTFLLSGWLLSTQAAAQSSPAVQQAETLIQRGDLQRAERVLQQALQNEPSAHAHFLMGFVHIRQFEYGAAEVSLRKAVAAAPREAHYRHALAKSLLEQGKNRAAMDELDQAIAIEPRPDYFFARAMCALNVADFSRAQADLEASLATSADNPEAWFELGKLRVNRGDNAQAEQALTRALGLQPAHLEARFYLGLSQKRSGESEAAMAAFEKVLEQVPGHVGALMNLGQLQMRSGDKAEGKKTLARFSQMSALRDDIEFHKHAVKKNPDNVNGRIALAQKQLEIGNHADATEQLLAARQLQPGNPRIYVVLAEAFRRQGRQAQAEQAENYAQQLQARARQQGPQQ